MKVYLVIHSIFYDCDEVDKVFSSFESALHYLKENYKEFTNGHYDATSILTYVVDGEAIIGGADRIIEDNEWIYGK